MKNFRKILTGVLSFSLLATNLNLVVSAKTIEDVDMSITEDTIGSNNYSEAQLIKIIDDIIDNVFNNINEPKTAGTRAVFDEEDHYLYSYILVTMKTETSKQLVEDYCTEHGYNDIVTIVVDSSLEYNISLEEEVTVDIENLTEEDKIALGYIESTTQSVVSAETTGKTIDDVDMSITEDTIGSNNYSEAQLIKINNDILDNILENGINEPFTIRIRAVFDEEDHYLYSYILATMKTETSKQLVEDYCTEHGYNDIVDVIVDPELDYITLGSIEVTLGDSNASSEITLGDSPTGIRGDIDYDGDVDAVDLLLLKKYLLQMITW